MRMLDWRRLRQKPATKLALLSAARHLSGQMTGGKWGIRGEWVWRTCNWQAAALETTCIHRTRCICTVHRYVHTVQTTVHRYLPTCAAARQTGDIAKDWSGKCQDSGECSSGLSTTKYGVMSYAIDSDWSE